MDPTQEQQRQLMRDALSSIGISAAAISSFDDSTLDKLVVANFHLPERLPSASREDLKEAGLALGDVSLIMSKVQGSLPAAAASVAGLGAAGAVSDAAAESGSGSSIAGETKLYNNVILFVPGYKEPYAKLDFKHLSKKQFVTRMEREHYFRVVTVTEQPSQPLALEKCAPNSVDISEVQLQDGVKLAVVVGAEHALSKNEKQVETIQGWSEGRIEKDDYEAAEWATLHIAGDKGASRWCYKIIAGLVDADQLKIEIGGMAFSQERVVLVERKPRIKLMYVHELADKMRKLVKLVAAGAPNTDMLWDRAAGEIKPLEAFLMADGWVDDPGEAAACAVRKEEEGIAPLLPTGDGGYAEHDSCGRWPVNDDTRQRGQNFLANNKPGRRRPKRSGSSVATAASGSGGAGGAAGPNRAVGIGRHASSSQQAACSPAHPAHHLSTHDPFSATSGAWLQRRVAPVCRPLHPPPLHPPRQHNYSMPSGRRL